MQITLSDTQQRSAALALLVLPVLLVAYFSMTELAASVSHHTQVSTLIAERDRYRSLITDTPALSREVRRIEIVTARENLLVGGRQISDSTSIVEKQIDRIVRADGASASQTTLEFRNAGSSAPNELHASVSFTTTISSLTHILYDLRSSRPLLFVTEIAIHPATSNAGIAQPTHLQVDLAITAFLRGP